MTAPCELSPAAVIVVGVNETPVTRPDRLPPEGGYVALVGFLAQMLGGAQDFVRCVSPGASTSDGGFNVLLKFEHEVHQQDVVVTGADPGGQRRRVLIQYKYSLNPPRYPIEPGELEDITGGLRTGEEAANREEELPTDFVLRTNRPLSRDSGRALRAAQNGEPDKVLTTRMA